ncbi:MAG TPA: PqiC family protein [Burkholderiaceae bacterium]|nr:PqiC family protein [Burkholderiaceae bacterium]
MTPMAEARILACVAWLLAVAGCADSPPPILYRLLDDPAPSAVRSPPGTDVVAIAPVRLPDRVDRARLVVIGDDGRVVADDSRRWAEPLPIAVEELLARRLAASMTGTWIARDRVGPVPDPRLRIALVVDEVDARLGGRVVVSARWVIADRRHERTRLGDVVVEDLARQPGYDGLVVALRRALEKVCDDVVADARNLQPAD